jgi:hypothetical protein
MSLRQHLTTRRSATVALATVGIAGSLLGGLGAAGNALAAAPSVQHPDAFVTVDSCSSVSGAISFSPGLRKTFARSTTAVLSGTTAGCSDAFTGAMPGNGSFTAILSGRASLATENFTGTFTVNWPGGTLNPSNGTLGVVAQGNHQYSVSGTVTSGADTGSVLSLGYLTTTQKGTGTKLHPVVSQKFVNTAPLALARNNG